jgi:hypothetical protein
MNRLHICVVLFFALGSARLVCAQADEPQPAPPAQPPASAPYAPITSAERVHWVVDGTVGPMSLGVGVLSATWSTAWNTPDEWGRTPGAFGKRYAAREADVAISNSIEAGLGAIWGEDPRYIRAPAGSVRSRFAYAMKTVMLAPRRDGHLAPAWGRYAANTVNNLIENTYLPPSVTTAGQTTYRSVSGFITRALGNLWEEFWPDIKKRLRR